MTAHRMARTLAATALIALSVWAAQRAIHIGWASYQSIEARALRGQWIARPGLIDPLVWNRAREGFLTE